MRERAILIQASLRGQEEGMDLSLRELAGLAETAGAEVVGEIAQRLPRYEAATLIGRGKAEEAARLAASKGARTAIFDAELSASQQKVLEKIIPAKIIDRTRLILDIFARRARTHEGRIQVELAQLSYMLPRLTGAWRAFSQQVGGIGTRGPGERKIEYERRHIQLRIKQLKSELEAVKRARSIRRQKRLRVPVPQIAIIGYTNAGKSTLLNALAPASAPVYADDKLFATLDPTARRVRLPSGGFGIFTDTVGFIRRLPTALIAAFRATLEEASLADCILFVSDASSPDRAIQEKAVEEILSDLGASRVPLVRALSKADLLDAAERARLSRAPAGPSLISANTGEGLRELLDKIEGALSPSWSVRTLVLEAPLSKDAPLVYESAQILSCESEDGLFRYRMRVTSGNWERIQRKLGSSRLKRS